MTLQYSMHRTSLQTNFFFFIIFIKFKNIKIWCQSYIFIDKNDNDLHYLKRRYLKQSTCCR